MSFTGTARTCPLVSIAMASTPAKVRRAVQKPYVDDPWWSTGCTATVGAARQSGKLKRLLLVRRCAASASRRYVGTLPVPTTLASHGAQDGAHAPRGGAAGAEPRAGPPRAGRAWRAPTMCRVRAPWHPFPGRWTASCVRLASTDQRREQHGRLRPYVRPVVRRLPLAIMGVRRRVRHQSPTRARSTLASSALPELS
jgi:hypothetical protein